VDEPLLDRHMVLACGVARGLHIARMLSSCLFGAKRVRRANVSLALGLVAG
jgi:hypothetical protein